MMIKIQKIIPQMTVHAAYGEEIWATKKYTLYKSGLKFEKFNIVAQLPVSPWLRMAARSRSISRFFRLGVRSMKKLASGTILIIADRKIFRLTDDDIQVVYSFRFGQGPLRDGWCFDPEGNCYFGEYFLNKNRKYPIHFYHSDDDGQTWNQVSAFNDIRHIHCVYHDPYSGQIWMSTGDRDRESKIMFTENGGTTWTPVGSGNQKFRAVSLIFTRDSIYWGSDSPTRQNYIFRYIRRTGEVESLAPVNGPVHCSFKTGNGILLFGTTAEGNSEGKSAAWDNKAHILGSQNGHEWQDLISWEKDRWPYGLGYGRIYFASGHSLENDVYFSPQAVKSCDNSLIHAKINF